MRQSSSPRLGRGGRRRGALGRAAVPLAAALLLAATAALAQQADCSRYFDAGPAPGMSSRQVWEVMGGPGSPEGRIPEADGYRSIEGYRRPPARILVEYDGMVSKRSTAHVVSIETAFDTQTTEIDGLLASIVDRLGRPSSGSEHLVDGLQGGEARWVDPACDVRVTVSRRPTPWWEPTESPEIHVRVEPLAPVPAATPPRTGPTKAPRSASAEPLVAGANGVTPPERIHAELPSPPLAARVRQIGGEVVLQVVVQRDGRVGAIDVQRVSHPGLGLERSAVEAVRRWRYRPATLEGEPVDAYLTVHVRFE